jgi:hypothetical protein
VLDPAEVRKRVANEPDTPYHGIDVDKVPNLLGEEEEEGLEPKGAAARIAEAAEGDRDQDDDGRAEPQRGAA